MSRLIEAVHYPTCHHQTYAEKISVNILPVHLTTNARTLVLLDDLTPVEHLPSWRRGLPYVPIDFHPNYVEWESQLNPPAMEALELLKVAGAVDFQQDFWEQKLLDRGRKETCIPGGWFFGKIRLTYAERPVTVLRDLGLTLKKHRYGFDHLVNILHEDYANEQCKLKLLVAAALPHINLQVIIYNLSGESWEL